MGYIIQKMTKAYAWDIASWKYDPPYNIYNGIDSEEFIEELLSGNYYAVTDSEDEKDNKDLIGYYCFGDVAKVPAGTEYNVYEDDMLDIGLGIKPNLCGRGLGYRFLRSGLKFGRYYFKKDNYRITVAMFNKRAIDLYEKLGFVKIDSFRRNSNNGEDTFLTMGLRYTK